MQIKITMRYHFTPVRMAIIKKSKKQQVLSRMWRKGNPSALLVELQTGVATVENSMEIPQKMELPFDPAIPLLGIQPKRSETLIQKNICTPMFIAASFTVAKS